MPVLSLLIYWYTLYRIKGILFPKLIFASLHCAQITIIAPEALLDHKFVSPINKGLI
jgi:hypothetical protein